MSFRRFDRVGLRPLAQQALRRRRSYPLGGIRQQRPRRGTHRGFLRPRACLQLRAAHGRMRILRGYRRPAAGRHDVRRGARLACAARHGGYGRPSEFRFARCVVGSSGRGIRVPAAVRESLQPALLQGAVRELRFPELLQPEYIYLEMLRRLDQRRGIRPCQTTDVDAGLSLRASGQGRSENGGRKHTPHI